MSKIPLALLLLLSSPAMAEDFDGKVIGITDGDTITVLHSQHPEKIRLSGIDCPEKSQAYGTQAKQFTASLVFGKQVHVRDFGKDRYGRTIGDITTQNDTALNQELVKAGYAWWYRKYSRDPILGQLESEAKAAGRGLWASQDSIPPWQFRHRSPGHPLIPVSP